MIRPPGLQGALFTARAEGDLRGEPERRRELAATLQISDEWAVVRQVHGRRVVEATEPGSQGRADALFTRVSGLPLAVFVADCVPVILEGARAVGVAHAGWRSMAQGIVAGLREAMEAAGAPPQRAAIGPSIGPCCFEVGAEVAGAFPLRTARTSWGTTSVDLWSAAQDQLKGLAVWRADRCSFTAEDCFSHRRDGTAARMAGLAWLS